MVSVIAMTILISAVATGSSFQLMLHLIGFLVSSLFLLHLMMEVHWKIYLVLLTYLGGLFVLFLYMASTWCGKLFYFYNSVFLALLSSIGLMAGQIDFNMPGAVEIMGFTFILSYWLLPAMVVVLGYLLGLLILVSIIISSLNQPMRML